MPESPYFSRFCYQPVLQKQAKEIEMKTHLTNE